MAYTYNPASPPPWLKPAWNRLAIVSLCLQLSFIPLLAIFQGHYVSYTDANGDTIYQPSLAENLGILPLILVLIIGTFIAGIVCAHIARSYSRRDLRGRGFANASLIIGYGAIGLFVFGMVGGAIIVGLTGG